MPTLEQELKNERRVSYLLWKAINSQLELEKLSEELMKDIYGNLKSMKAAGSPREDWTRMCGFAQQLVNTLKMLRNDNMLESMIEEDNIEIKSEEETKDDTQQLMEEDIEEHIEVLMREMHPNLDQIKAEAEAEAGSDSSLRMEDLHDIFGLAKQMAKPHKTLGKREDKLIKKGGSIDVKGKNKKKEDRESDLEGKKAHEHEQKDKKLKRKKEETLDHVPKHRRN